MKLANKLITLLRPLLFLKKAFLSSPPSLAPSPQRGEGQSVSPGPVFRIQTRPRFPEILLKLNSIFSRPFQAPDFGSSFKSPLIHNSFLYKVFITLIDVITTGTERLLTPLSLMGRKVPRLGASLAGTVAAGSLFFGTVKDAVADTGDYISIKAYDLYQGKQPEGAGFDNQENMLYYIEQSDNSVWRVSSNNNYENAPGEFVLNLEAGDEYFGLGFGRVNGVPQVAVSNVSDCELEVYNVNNGAQIGSKVIPANSKGITFNNGWDVFIRSPPKRINKYNKNTLELEKESEELTNAGLTALGDSEITFDSTNNLYYAIFGNDSGFYTFNLENNGESQTIVTNLNEWDVNSNPGTRFFGAAFNESALELIITDYQDPGWAFIYGLEGYNPPPPTPTPAPTPPILILDSGDYDGNGTSDIGIFRSFSGLWAIRGISRVYFGSDSDIPASGDYDGDGSSDIAIFRPSSGLWAIKGVTRAYFGSASDTAVPGDYDRDGVCEVGIFRKSSGLWAIRGVTRAYFGGSNDRPVPGYFQGKAPKNIAIFRPSSSLWAIRGVTRAYFGSYADWPAPADYTSIGTEDIGLFRSHSGLWALKGVSRTYFGGSSDRPVPGDYTGSGTSGIGIFRETSGLWAVLRTTRVYFGGNGDIPLGAPPCRRLTPTPTPTITPPPSPYPTCSVMPTIPATPVPTFSPTPTVPVIPTPTPAPTMTPVSSATPAVT